MPGSTSPTSPRSSSTGRYASVAAEHPVPPRRRPPDHPGAGGGGAGAIHTCPIHPQHGDQPSTPPQASTQHPGDPRTTPGPGASSTRHTKEFDVMYTITSTPGGRTDTAETIPQAVAALAAQLTSQLPDGPVTWSITDPSGGEHRGHEILNGRLDLLTEAVDQLTDELYTQLHRAADQAAAAGGETTRP